MTEFERMIEVPGGKIFAKMWQAAQPEHREHPEQREHPAQPEPPELSKHHDERIPLFLLHDSLGSVELWRDFPSELSQRLKRTVIAYDRLGYGKSTERVERPTIQFINEEAEIYFPELMKALNIKKFDLFGHSVGGAMAIVCATKIPGCRSVVTEAAQAFVENRTLEGIKKAQKDFQNSKNLNRLRKYHGSKAQWVLQAWTDVWLSPEFSTWSLEPLLPEVRCPLLAIHGDNDEYGSIAFPQMISDLTSGLSQMSVIPNCGHVPHREKPEVVFELLQDFYGSL